MRYIFSIIFLFSLLIFTKSQINSAENLPDIYQRLASLYCFIDNYPAWLEQQLIFNYFLEFAQFYYIDTDRIKQELEQYRLQRECLKALERLTIIFGSG